MITKLPAPGQIWFKRGSKVSFCEVVTLHRDTPVSMRVGFKPLVQNAGGEITIIAQDPFLNNFHFVLDLYDWLQEFRTLNPGWSYPPAPDQLEIHQIWSLRNDPSVYVRVQQIGLPEGDAMSYSPVAKEYVQPTPIPFSKKRFQDEFRYVVSLIDVLKTLRIQMQLAR